MNQEDYDNYLMQSDIERQRNESQNSVYAPQLMEQLEQRQAVLVEQTNPNKAVKEILLNIQALKELPDGRLVRKKLPDGTLIEPRMNEKGVMKVEFVLTSFINQNTILTHLDDKQIAKWMIQVADDLTDDLTLSWREYGIKNKMDLDIIMDAVLNVIYCAYNRALGQNEKNWLKTMTMETVSSAPRIMAPKKESFWSKFKI